MIFHYFNNAFVIVTFAEKISLKLEVVFDDHYWQMNFAFKSIFLSIHDLYILLETSTRIISHKNTSTNRHVESANLIYIALPLGLIHTLQKLDQKLDILR